MGQGQRMLASQLAINLHLPVIDAKRFASKCILATSYLCQQTARVMTTVCEHSLPGITVKCSVKGSVLMEVWISESKPLKERAWFGPRAAAAFEAETGLGFGWKRVLPLLFPAPGHSGIMARFSSRDAQSPTFTKQLNYPVH
ncbi:hypothetical protein GOODEAATRI_028816 [Goodea atripinnis]|uniref:Uncharacterized protein n=1 Tax=Goodea atripinnis TaxID=208336 RepID=A0ABV0PTB8_9TELE